MSVSNSTSIKFRKVDLALMSRFGVAESDVLDVRGRRPVEWKAEAKERGYDFVYSDKCKHGHRIRTRTNDCIGCRPAAVSFLRRHSESGWVYLAVAQGESLVKVGSCSNVEERMFQLNSQGYCGRKTWRLVAYAWAAEKGTFEHAVFRSIDGKMLQNEYISRNTSEVAREVKIASPWSAVLAFISEALTHAVTDLTVEEAWSDDD